MINTIKCGTKVKEEKEEEEEYRYEP